MNSATNNNENNQEKFTYKNTKEIIKHNTQNTSKYFSGNYSNERQLKTIKENIIHENARKESQWRDVFQELPENPIPQKDKVMLSHVQSVLSFVFPFKSRPHFHLCCWKSHTQRPVSSAPLLGLDGVDGDKWRERWQ